MSTPQQTLPTEAGSEHQGIHGVQYPLMQPASGWKRWAKARLGALLGRIFVARMAALRAGRWPEASRLTGLDRILISALVEESRKANALGSLSGLHQSLWRTDQAVSVHAQAEARYQSWWLDKHSAVLTPLASVIAREAARGRVFDTLCEIGTGTGTVLADVAQRLPQFKQLIGLDLSATQTAANRQRFEGQPRLRFETADATEWIAAQAESGWVYFVNGGVFEYFSEAMLDGLLTDIATKKAPALIALVEPLAADYDLATETASRPYNLELSLGHHYPHHLKRCGWQVESLEEQQVGGARWLLVVASTGLV